MAYIATTTDTNKEHFLTTAIANKTLEILHIALIPIHAEAKATQFVDPAVLKLVESIVKMTKDISAKAVQDTDFSSMTDEELDQAINNIANKKLKRTE